MTTTEIIHGGRREIVSSNRSRRPWLPDEGGSGRAAAGCRRPRRSWLRWLGGAAVAFPLVAAALLAAPPPPLAGGFTLVVLPDTQVYSLKYPATYQAQTQWIADHARSHHIVYALHVGDITDKNTPAEWEVAAAAHARLAGVVPVAFTPGNHDLRAGRETGLTRYFPAADLRRLSTFGGNYDREPERTDNSYHLFTAGDRSWLILALEFGPRDDVLRWANEVVARHAARSVILVTHAYLRNDGTRYDRNVKVMVKGKESNKGLNNSPQAKSPAGFNDGEDLWRKLVSAHANFAFVISGHTCLTAHRTDAGRHGNPVHQILVDYQNQPNGGDGYLRLLQFSADTKTVRVSDYSPTLDRVSPTPGTSFTLAVPPRPTAAP